jgi:hypothetical protein
VRSPDFFLVGAPKCGTTALYAMLGAHPEIFVSPIKEPDFFAADIQAAILGGRATNDWARYLELFNSAAPGQKLGEGSVSYLASRLAAAAIHEWCPDARILMVLRDPADRLFSHYSAAVAARSTRQTFPDWLRAAAVREKTDAAPIGPVVAGRYGANLQRYLAVFPASRIHIIWHEDYVTDARATVRSIFTFLGVAENQQVPVSVRRNETRVLKWGLFPMRSVLRPSPADRGLAIQLYEDDIRVLAGLTGRDLSPWTR